VKKHITKTRIIGIILLVISLLAYFSGKAGSTSLALAGIILLIAPTKHGKSMFDLFINSFTRWKTIVITALYESLFWLAIFGTMYFFYSKFQAKLVSTEAQTFLTPQAMTQAPLLQQTNTAIYSFIQFVIVGAVVVILISFLAYTLSRTMIWTTLANKEPSKKFFLKFAALNAGWWGIWIAINLLIVFAMSSHPNLKEALVVLLLLAFYFGPIVQTLYMTKGLVGYSISNGVAWGIAKIHLLIVPYTFAFVLYVIAYQPFKLVQSTQMLSPASMLFVVIFIAWLRTYIYSVIKTFK